MVAAWISVLQGVHLIQILNIGQGVDGRDHHRDKGNYVVPVAVAPYQPQAEEEQRFQYDVANFISL